MILCRASYSAYPVSVGCTSGSTSSSGWTWVGLLCVVLTRIDLAPKAPAAKRLQVSVNCSVGSEVQRRRHALREYYKDSIHLLLECRCATINWVRGGVGGRWVFEYSHGMCAVFDLCFLFSLSPNIWCFLFVCCSFGKSLVIPVELLVD